jgi:hypothetical protein
VKFEEIDESCYAFAPVQVLPELYIDLDMQLLTARRSGGEIVKSCGWGVGLRSLQAVKNWPAGVLSTMGSASSSQAKVNSPGMSESPDIPGRFSSPEQT